MKKKTLYFIKGPVPTKADIEAAQKLEGAVFRNANFVGNEGRLEDCNAVAGAIPARYAAKFGVEAEGKAKAEGKPKGRPKAEKPSEPSAPESAPEIPENPVGWQPNT